jgi:hypothetical protein
VLEISVDGGAFADITSDGNPFISGAYNATIPTYNGSPIAGRRAWSGLSPGYVTSSINLPPAAVGHDVRLRWKMASDNCCSSFGVRIDSITVGAASYVCSTCSAPFTDPLVVGVTVAKGVHVTELRSRINAQRVRFGLGAYPWTDATLTPAGTVLIKAMHVTEMRTALAAAYTAHGLTPPVYTDSALAPGTTVKAIHITELRNAVISLEAS